MSGEKVLYYCGGKYRDPTVTKVIIATGVTIINNNAFFYCEKLQSVVFEEPHQVTEIGEEAFYGCHALETIELPDSLRKIGLHAFAGCRALRRRIVIPVRVTSIGVYVFQGSGIEEIFLSDGIKSIQDHAYAGCPRLHTVRLPASLKEIVAAFSYCDNLENVIVPADGLPLLKRLDLGGFYQSPGWEDVCKVAQKAPNLTSLSLSSVRVGGRKLDDSDIPLVIEMVSSCPHLESLNLSNNAFSDQAIRIFDSQGILGRLQNVNFRCNCGTGSILSSNDFLNLLLRNPRVAIWTDHEWEYHKWEYPKDYCLIRHYLDMNRYGSRGVPIRNVSIWPRLIDRLGRIDELKTSSDNVLYHLLREQNHGLSIHYQHNRTKRHTDCENRIGRLKATKKE